MKRIALVVWSAAIVLVAAGLTVVAVEDRKATASVPTVTRWVDPINGNDANTGTYAFPWKSMNKAGQWVASTEINSLTRVQVGP